MAVAMPWINRTANNWPGVSTNWYVNGIKAKKAVPARSHDRRPHRSDRAPTSGFSTMPVSVETETMIPRNASDAPSMAAKIGNRGVLPIWYADRTTKSADVMSAKLRSFLASSVQFG